MNNQLFDTKPREYSNLNQYYSFELYKMTIVTKTITKLPKDNYN